MIRIRALCVVLLWSLAPWGAPLPAQPGTRVTVLTDAFGKRSALARDWGYAALVEHDGKRILFDTGNDAGKFAANVRRLGVDLTRLDFVVISHRHGDHTDGLRHLLRVNPRVRIYVPSDEYFGGPTPPAYFRRADPSLPAEMRYFGGDVPDTVPHGTPWKPARFVRVDSALEVMPGVRLVRNVSRTQQFSETPELSLALDTEGGQVVLVGCSHPGIEAILASLHARERPVRLLMGGLHLVTTADAEVERLALALRDEWKLGGVAPGHCTGEPAFARLQRAFGTRYRYAGVGSVVTL